MDNFIIVIITTTTTTTTTTAIEFSLGGSSSYTSTDRTNKNKYTQTNFSRRLLPATSGFKKW
jgi:hypothetical protein